MSDDWQPVPHPVPPELEPGYAHADPPAPIEVEKCEDRPVTASTAAFDSAAKQSAPASNAISAQVENHSQDTQPASNGSTEMFPPAPIHWSTVAEKLDRVTREQLLDMARKVI